MNPTKTCRQCGNEFAKRQGEQRDHWDRRIYCGRQCFYASMRRDRPVIACAQCGTEFTSTHGKRGRERRYCSHRCSVAAREIPLADRLWARTDTTGGPESCWEWQGYRSPAGYGEIGLGRGKGIGVTHRVAWELERGPIPEDMFVCHHCDNPP